MKNSKIKISCVKLANIILSLMVLVAFIGTAAAEIIPPARKVTWQGNVGVEGDIPSRTTIYTTLNPTGDITDRVSAIQTALNSCPPGQVVYLNAGTYYIGSTIVMPSNVTLRGAGMGSTIIKGAETFSGSCLVAFGTSSYIESGKTVSAGATKGSTSLTVDSHGYDVGDILILDMTVDEDGDPWISISEIEGCSYCGRESGARPCGQIVKVSAVDANTITVDIPLYYNYTEAPEVARLYTSYFKHFSGLEGVTIDNNLSKSRVNENYGIIDMIFSSNCWLLDVEISEWERIGLRVGRGYRNTIRGCYFHGPTIYTSNRGYGLWMQTWTSACLVENNVIADVSVGIMIAGLTSGNAIAYNYLTDHQSTTFPTAARGGLCIHAAHPIMNLFEGNYLDGPCLAADLYHGTGSHNTFFRNRQITDTTKSFAIVGCFLWKGHTYYNVVGNVFGTDGFETIYENQNYDAGKMIYCFDYAGGGVADGETENTLILHGNYDYVNDNVVWDPSITDKDLPSSLYRSNKPGWFGSLQWPAIGPDLNPMTGTIPAKLRYEGQNVSESPIPQPPLGLRIVQ